MNNPSRPKCVRLTSVGADAPEAASRLDTPLFHRLLHALSLRAAQHNVSLEIELNSPSIRSKPRLSSSVFCPRIELVAQIEFTECTPDGHLRHSKFVGLREDKDAREVMREGRV